VPALYDLARHEPLAELDWTDARAQDAIAAICADVMDAFAGERLWPVHPGDIEPDMPADGVFRGLYLGAAGVLHALARLADAGLFEPGIDFAAVASELHAASLASPDEDGAGASLLAGSSGILLVSHRYAPSSATADALADAIAANVTHPSNELLLGAPGTMLAARAMHARTGEDRFADLWRASALELLARQEADGLWTQDLYGDRLRYLGAGHGFAGNIRALFGARAWLERPAELETRALAATRAIATVDRGLVNWPALDTGSRTGAPPRVQWCHGAPGMICCLAGLGAGDEQHGALLDAAGEFVWQAGPIAGNAGLCHGTSGNGFAFLGLFARTGDDRWLARARAFALHAIAQVDRLRAATGMGRYTLFTGDLGAALLAAACLDGAPGFPGIDDL
jgi:hypothetical protein